MLTKDFEARLDRWGTDFATWPEAEAEAARLLLVWSKEAQSAYEALRQVEVYIAQSRPEISAAQAERVVRRAVNAIARREANPPLLERFRRMLLAPLPRAAMAMSLTAIGFAIGLAVTAPATGARFDVGGSPLMPTSADDVLF
jgi:hypothetical protein